MLRRVVLYVIKHIFCNTLLCNILAINKNKLLSAVLSFVEFLVSTFFMPYANSYIILQCQNPTKPFVF